MKTRHHWSFLITASIVLVLSIHINPANAQQREAKRNFGLSTYVSNPMSFSQLDIMVPIWAGKKLVVAPIASVSSVENVGTDLGAGILLRIYQTTTRVRPYWGVKGKAFIMLPSGGSSITDFLAGLFYGGEFFINSRFSFGVEAQVYAAFPNSSSSRFGSPGNFVIFTKSGIIATVHF